MRLVVSMRYSLESPGNYGWGSLDSGGTINQKGSADNRFG